MKYLVVTDNAELNELARGTGTDVMQDITPGVSSAIALDEAETFVVGEDAFDVAIASGWKNFLAVGFDMDDATLEQRAADAGAGGLIMLPDVEARDALRHMLESAIRGSMPALADPSADSPQIGDFVTYHGTQGDMKIALVLGNTESVTPGSPVPVPATGELHLMVHSVTGSTYMKYSIKRSDGETPRPTWSLDRP